MRVSVVMTTYNGEYFIEKQLDSLRNQTVRPNEVIIADDQSKDSTVTKVQEYIRKYELDDWTVYVNANNLGWKKNFYSVINKATADLVFFCDQDDIWEKNKIEEIINIFGEHEEVDVVSSALTTIDGDGEKIDIPKSIALYGKKLGPLLKRNEFNRHFAYTIRPGCTMAVRRKFIDRLSKYENCYIKNSYTMPHDALYWMMGTILGKAYLLNKELIKYRIHSNNASNPNHDGRAHVSRLDERKKSIEYFKNQLEVVNTICNRLDKVEFKRRNMVATIDDSFNLRICYIEGKKINLFALANMWKFGYRNLRMFLGDTAVRLRLK